MKPILTDDEQYYLKAFVMLRKWEVEAIEEEANRPRTRLEKVGSFIYDTIAILFAIAIVAMIYIMVTWEYV